MNKLLLASAALFAAGTIFAQSNSIPNPGFENWTIYNYQDPTGYQSSNDGNNGNGPIPIINVTRTTNAYHGNYAVQLKTTKVGADTVASYAAIGNPGGGSGGNTGGAAMSGMPKGIRLYYTYTKKAADSALVFVVFKKAGATIGQYEYLIYDTTSSYQLFSQLFSPALTAAPDTVIFAFASSVRVTNQHNNNSSGWAPGSVFQIDSVTFTGVATQPTNFNGDFENWKSDSDVVIQGWNVYEGSDSGNASRTTDAFAGKYAVQLTTGPCSGCGGGNVSPQGITSGTNSNNNGPHGGLPYTMTKDTLEFYYKYTPSAAYPGDTAVVFLNIHNGTSNQEQFNIYLNGTGGSYVKEDYPFQVSSFTPDTVLINIQSSYSNKSGSGNGLPSIAVGSTLKVDNMRFLSQVPITITPANPSYCAGGSVTLKATGATSYTWAPNTNLSATTGSSVNANPFFTTTYTVTGTNGTATGTQTVVVVVNNAPTVNISPSAPSICIGNSVGLTASGTAVSYVWSPATGLNTSTGASVNATPTTSITYIVTGTSAAGCTGANSVSVVVNTVPTLSVTPSAPGICAGGGAVNIKATGATNYFWSPAAGLNVTTGGNVNATPTVTTTYKVVGKNGACADSVYVKVIVDKAITVNLTTTDVTCNGSCNGTSMATPVGGISPYTYSWSTTPPQSTASATALCAGTYTVTVNDSIGCAGFATATVTQPTALSASTIPVNTTCGQSNGQGIANASGGTAPYTYSWNSVPVQTTQTATALAPGNYTLTVTDANNCTTITNLVINASTAPAITVKVTSSNCGINTGMAVASVTGGTTPYSYSWNNGSTTNKDSGVGAGVYIITVTDKNGCSSFKAVTVSDTNGPTISASTVVDNNCSGQSIGSVSITVSGGTKPYHYIWSNGSTIASIGGLQAGPYQVTVSDGGGCSIVKSFTITSPAPVALITGTTQAGCGVSDGSASVTASGGTAPYSYAWSTAATSTSISSIAAGTYSVLVTDHNGCKDSIDASVSNASGPVATISSLVNVNCSTGVMGSISVSDSGGTTPYTYLWSNGATTSSIDSLVAGNYNVVVTDAGGCKGTTNATIGEVLPPAISICMVTVDVTTEYNTIIWDKSSTKKIASYNIYKESTAPGVYSKIGSVKANSLCQFVDTLSNSLVQSWRYEISQVDSCGGESPLSLPHKTMHLTINVGATGGYNLIWDNYQGLSFSKYYVYRDTVAGVANILIDSVLNNGNFTYSNTPPKSGSYYYHMSINNPGGCTPSIQALNYNASKSNTGNVTFVGIATVDAEINSFDVYPNPNSGVFNLNISLANAKQNVSVRILNTMGQVLSNDNYNEVSGKLKKLIDLSGYSKGIYLVQVITGNGSMYRKVVVQ
ncbi:MAG TPA: T9SS type A sorting domain-containing protein [Bacteroidia bacterium]|nr:T9SS type A sorting domain-containing protein [Bacteroidia bacterium]